MPPAGGATGTLVELRILDGANLYFNRAAVKLTLDVTRLLEASFPQAREYAAAVAGTARSRPGPPTSMLRQRWAARLVDRALSRLVRAAGVRRLGIRVRPQGQRHLVVAYPWRHRTRAEVAARQLVAVLDALVAGGLSDEVWSAAATAIRDSEPGPAPPTLRPAIPVVAVTGTNGKTTTSRLIAHIGRTKGWRVGWSSTDGIYVDGELVEAGDYSGPSGAGEVLRHDLDLAVTETARGGILRRGIGVAYNDVSVVTNISEDHLGMDGIDTIDQLAEVKSVLVRITKPSGWCVVNGDDPRVFAMRQLAPGTPWVFTRDPDSPSIREVLDAGGRATTVIDGQLAVLGRSAWPEAIVALVDVPMTLAGLSAYNVENVLAAASAGLALGLSDDCVRSGLASFAPGPQFNPGRMNVYSVPAGAGRATVVLDLAHNEAGLSSLLEIAHGLKPEAATATLVLGTAGDRTDEQFRALGELGARHADRVVIALRPKYMRGRTDHEFTAMFAEGAAAVGVTEVPTYPDESAAVRDLVEHASDGDVIAVMCISKRVELDTWIRDQGGSVDSPETIRAKALG